MLIQYTTYNNLKQIKTRLKFMNHREMKLSLYTVLNLGQTNQPFLPENTSVRNQPIKEPQASYRLSIRYP